MLTNDDREVVPLLDYRPCSYDGCRLTFRGPGVSIHEPFIAVLGGTETFGKYVADPYPALLCDWLNLPVANFGIAQAGLSLFSEEPWLIDTCSQAKVTIVQVLGAQNMSNRMYSVHSRRNDRFLAASPALRDLYPDVDFSQINFTGHLFATLAEQCSDNLRPLIDELKWAWVQRMKRLTDLIESDVVLLWMSDRTPDVGAGADQSEPHFVDRAMLEALADDIAGVVEIDCSEPGLDGMIFGEGEDDAARQLPGPNSHVRAAEGLVPVIADVLKSLGPPVKRTQSDNQSFSINSGTAVKRSATRP